MSIGDHAIVPVDLLFNLIDTNSMNTYYYNIPEEDTENDDDEKSGVLWTIAKFAFSPLSYLIYLLDVLMDGRIKKIRANDSNLTSYQNIH